ncbi:uncharacterized protein DDB_G0284459-like isoform X2 [Cydia fagiglandana]|uniref:uncharacterized protein DDB_G0284459-like isoform X2 n=1 Tax=Cydia fagiglandana TaxID=1458189 RepID=UPI002FEDEAB6
MVLFRHALQVCTIACVSIAIDGHLMLAVNVEDFRNLANKFLAKDLADRLTNLVTEISLKRRKENQQRVEKILWDKEIPIKELARTNKQLTDTTVATAESTKYYHYKPKRFNTVKNSDSKELRQDIYNTPPGPVYVRDEIEDLLQNINEGNSDHGTKKVVTPEGLVETDYNIVSKEATRPLNLMNMSRENRIDYTETKLGEWKYNQDISIEPPAIKNSKTGNANRDINDEGSIDYDDGKKGLNVQYVDETRLLGRHKKDDSHTFEEHMLGEKNEINHENTPPKQDDTTISHDIKEVKKDSAKSKMSLNDFLKDSPEVKRDKSEEKETYQIPPPMQPIESNDMYEKYALGSSIKSNNKKGVNDQSVEDGTEKHNRETKQIQNDDNDKNVDNQSGNIEHSILRNKKKYQHFKVPENREESSKAVTPEQISTNGLLLYDENKSESDKSKPDVSKKKSKIVKKPVHDVTSTEEATEESKEKKADYDPHISKEETDTHEKFELGSHNKKNNKRKPKPKQQAEISDKINKLIKKENKTDNDDELHIQDKNNKSYKLLLRNKQFKDSKYCKQNPNSRMCREEELTTKIALSESAEVSRPLPVKGKKESFSDQVFSFKIKDHQVNYDLIKSTHKRPQKKIEENDTYDKYELGRETKNDDDRKRKLRKQKENGDIKIMDGKNKLNYQGHNKNKSANSEEMPIKSKRKPQKKIEENDMYDKYELGRETDNDNKVKRKQKHNDDIKTTDAKNKLNYQGRNKDKIEEHDMYDKYELGRDTDNDNKVKRKQKHNDDIKTTDAKNKLNYQGRNKDKIEEHDMYDKYELGRETDNDDKGKRKQKHNDDIKTTDAKNKFNYQGRNKDKIEENDMYDKYELGRDTDNDDKEKRKQKHNDEIKTTDAKNKINYQDRNKDKKEEHDMYDNYELGRETDNDNKEKRKQKHNDEIKTTDAKNKFNYQDRYKDKFASNDEMPIKSSKKPLKIIKENIKHDISRSIESANNEEMPIKSKEIYENVEDTTTKSKETKHGKDQIEKVPIADYADDPQPNFKEVNAESIKAATGRLLDSEEPKGNGRTTKKFRLKGTVIPKRDFYKLSSPDYYKDLPRIVEKYDFEEPIPEQDRLRDKVRYLKREPSRVNRKLKLPQFEKT